MDFKYFNTHLLNKTIQGAKGSYKIQNLIAAGTGGMVMCGLMKDERKVAVKYQSYISEHETSVCLKFLDQSFSNIVNILDIFKNEGHPGFFIIMDFADMPLTKYLNGKNEFADTKSQQFQSMIKQICYGILELHQMKIIHRDFKPDNIVVKLDNNTTKYMLCDLGLVRSDENDIKKTKQIGTPMFMAPELLNDEQYSVKVDIWALGCMLYLLLARKSLFEGNTVQETLKQVSKITQQEIDFKINQIQQLDYQFKQLLIQMIQINQSKRLTIIQVIEYINQYYENINNQQTPIQQGQIQSNNQFIHQQIIINQKPKLLPQQQLKIQYERIEKGIEIQRDQMRDKFQYKLNESEQKLFQQYCKVGLSYSSEDVQSIIKQTIQAVQSQSFDIIDQLFVVKLESDKKIILEQLGQKDLKFIGHQTELNQKLIEINKNLEKINNLQEQLKTCKSEKEQNDNIIKDLSYQLQQQQDQINQQNKQIKNQLEEMCLLKGQLELQFIEFQNKEKKHQEQININRQQQDEINGLLEQNQKMLNQYEQQKQFIQQKIPEYERTIAQLQEKLQLAEEQFKQTQQSQQIDKKTINQLEEKLKLAELNLEQAKFIQQQQGEKIISVDDSINKKQIMLGYLQKLTDYVIQQESSSLNKNDQSKNNDLSILNVNESKQNEIQQEIQSKIIFNQQNFVPNQQVNPNPSNMLQQQNGQQQFQNPQNINMPFNQEQNSQQQFKPINQNNQYQNIIQLQQFQPPANSNTQLQKPNFINFHNPQFLSNQIAPNKSFQPIQSLQANSSVQQTQSQSKIFKQSFNPNIQNQDQK